LIAQRFRTAVAARCDIKRHCFGLLLYQIESRCPNVEAIREANSAAHAMLADVTIRFRNSAEIDES
jgi:hypothetical protein